VRLTNSKFLELNPAWSPDGIAIVFNSDIRGGADLWVVAAKGGGLGLLPGNSGASDGFASWAPEP
jgi:Tol biopolymer transport system component